MKPIRLEFQAFGPYKDREVIDFAKKVDQFNVKLIFVTGKRYYDEVKEKGFTLVPSRYIEFINRDENIDFDTKMNNE